MVGPLGPFTLGQEPDSQAHQSALATASASLRTIGQPQALQQVNGVTIKIKGCFQQGLVVGLLLW